MMMIRHASIIDNMLPDVLVAGPNGLGIRYVVKRELEAIPVIDIGGRWLPTQFLERVSKDPEAEIATMGRLTEDVGAAEAVLIYPEGTRATQKKIARAKEIVRERQPDVAPLAETMVNLLPPRLGGPLELLEKGQGMDVLFCRPRRLRRLRVHLRHLGRRAGRRHRPGEDVARSRCRDPDRRARPDRVAVRALAGDGPLGHREPRRARPRHRERQVRHPRRSRADPVRAGSPALGVRAP